MTAMSQKDSDDESMTAALANALFPEKEEAVGLANDEILDASSATSHVGSHFFLGCGDIGDSYENCLFRIVVIVVVVVVVVVAVVEVVVVMVVVVVVVVVVVAVVSVDVVVVVVVVDVVVVAAVVVLDVLVVVFVVVVVVVAVVMVILVVKHGAIEFSSRVICLHCTIASRCSIRFTRPPSQKVRMCLFLIMVEYGLRCHTSNDD